MAPPSNPPKAILFDIGGVVVVSPFRAILDYEIEHKIPIGYINYAIQKGPHDTGAWQLLERGQVPLNDIWFASFKQQLSQPHIWTEYLEKLSKSSSQTPSPPPATANSEANATPPVPNIDAKTLFWRMMKISRKPDPYMYPALRKLRSSRNFILGAFTNNVAFPPGIRDETGQIFTKDLIHAPAPHNPYANDSPDLTTYFDVFLGSADVGLRKPDPEAYRLAVREMDKVARARGMGGVTPGDTLFLDDIGVNLKFARQTGLRTIKVNLGRTREAVRELEVETGVGLLDERALL